MRNTALMTAGTTLSRLTGYVRIAAQTAALGVTVGALGNVYVQANTTPNIVYELILGGVLTSVFVPVFVDHRRAQGSEAAFDLGSRVLTLALVILTALAVVGIALAPQIMRLYLAASDARRPRGTDRAGGVPAQVVHAAGRVLRHRGDRGRVAQRRRPLRGTHVRPDPEQRRRDRRVRHLRGAARGIGSLGRGHHVAREDGARRRNDARRRRDDARALAVAASRRVPLETARRVAPSRHPARREPLGMGRALRLGEPARLPRDHRARRKHRSPGPLPGLCHGVRRLPAAPFDLRGVDLHGAAAEHGRALGNGRPRGGAASASRSGCATRWW